MRTLNDLQRLEAESVHVIICGSAGVGKSTMIGRMFDGGTQIGDGQNVAPDAATGVACRVFSTGQRKFIVAEASGHERHLSWWLAAGPIAEVAVLVVDAFTGLGEHERRLSHIVSAIGIGHVVVAVNKMDLVGCSQQAFDRIEGAYRGFAEKIGLAEVIVIPVSGLKGDNLIKPSSSISWYRGPALLQRLESVRMDERRPENEPLRLQVQSVDRQEPGRCGIKGTIAGGIVQTGQRIRVQPSGRDSTVQRIVIAAEGFDRAAAPQSVTLTLTDDIDIARGDLISAADSPAEVADQFEAKVIWIGEQPMLRGRTYLMEIGAKTVTATVSPLKYKINVSTLERVAANRLEFNDIGVADLQLDQRIAFDSYEANRDTGGFVLIDSLTHETVGIGMLRFALRRSQNVHWQALDVDKQAHASIKGQRPCVLWFTGYSGAGKSAIANLVEKKLFSQGRHTYLLDGDNVRHGLNKDLGFTDEARVENIRRVSEVAKLMVDAGLIVITAFISPFRSERRSARALMDRGEFIEVFIDTPIAVAEQRDPKGLYKKARSGQLANFTGVDSPYEAPQDPEIRIDTTVMTAEEAASHIVDVLRARGVFEPKTD